jgi:hypothetical protein
MRSVSISSKQNQQKVINSFNLVTDLRKTTLTESLSKFKMISLRSDKVRTLVVLVLFLVAVQCLVAEGKLLYNLKQLLQIFEPL